MHVHTRTHNMHEGMGRRAKSLLKLVAVNFFHFGKVVCSEFDYRRLASVLLCLASSCWQHKQAPEISQLIF